MAGGMQLFALTRGCFDCGSSSHGLRRGFEPYVGDGFDCGSRSYGLRRGFASKERGFRSKQVRRCVVAMVGMEAAAAAPSCIFVGPIETAEKARLEALYQQARDSYYSGQPLVVDDMFDKVEMQLRWHGSKLVLKYPRCSLRRFTAYADAELDPSQVRALTTIWSVLFAVGLSLATILPALQLHAHEPGTFFVMSDTNRMLFSVASVLIGVPVAQAAVQQLQALGRGDLVALKGNCPNCGEEVYTFVKPDQGSFKVRHDSECHICERQLVFHATLHPSKSGVGQPWAHGRVYLQTRAHQLAPRRDSP